MQTVGLAGAIVNNLLVFVFDKSDKLNQRLDTPTQIEGKPMQNKSLKLLKRSEVIDLLGVSKSTLVRWVQAGRFPRPIYLTADTPRWAQDDVSDWLAKREAASA